MPKLSIIDVFILEESMHRRIDILNICLWEVLCSLALLLFATNVLSSTITYEYDLSGQLVVASYGGPGRATFAYDAAGNMTSQAIVGAFSSSIPSMLLLRLPPVSKDGTSILDK